MKNFLFVKNPYENRVSEFFQTPYDLAISEGHNCKLISTHDKSFCERSISKLPKLDKPTEYIYIGWMIYSELYTYMYFELMFKNYILINNPQEYRNCHYLPESLKYIKHHTPNTIFLGFKNWKSILSLYKKAVSKFGDNPVIIKDYVKSEKDYWDTACFVPVASDMAKFIDTCNNIVQLKSVDFNIGFVVREFLELNKNQDGTIEEYRLLYYHGKLIKVWEHSGGRQEVNLQIPDYIEQIATTIPSNFFVIDIARKKDGEFIIIELGDGQVSELCVDTWNFE